MSSNFKAVLEKVKDSVCKNGLFEKGEKVLCALSGGADSVALLLILNELDVVPCAAHLNHGIRGAEADRDEAFCYELCEKLGVPFVSERVDVPGEAKKLGKGLEETAREIRYDFLQRVAKDFGCKKICTAHHADDNVETVLLHMIRGCGLNGLTGISPARENIVRPLLTLRKDELVTAVTERGYTFVHDSTNDQTYNTRNYIRHNILPHIYKLNESADKAFYRMCQSLSSDNEYLEKEAAKLPPDMKRKDMAELDDAILSRYIRRVYTSSVSIAGGLDSYSVQLIMNAVKNSETVRFDVTGDIVAYVSDSGLEFLKRKNETVTLDMPLEWGENIISPIGYRILITDDENLAKSFIKVYKSSISLQVKYDKIISNDGRLCASVRTRRTGDSYVYQKINKNVKRQLINRKIPVQKRDRLPVFYTDEGIFFVYGLEIADKFRAMPNEKAVYIVTCEIK